MRQLEKKNIANNSQKHVLFENTLRNVHIEKKTSILFDNSLAIYLCIGTNMY